MWRQLVYAGGESYESRLHSLLAVLQNPCAYFERYMMNSQHGQRRHKLLPLLLGNH